MVKMLGEFMTEFGDVEYLMFETILAVDPRDANEIHKAFYEVPFGPKLEVFKSAVKLKDFDAHRETIDHILNMLEKLKDQRDNIVHGETYHIIKGGIEKMFRVGFTKKNFKPWEGFDFKGNGKNIFEADDIGDVINDCIAIKVDLDRVRQDVVEAKTGHRPPYLSHTYEID